MWCSGLLPPLHRFMIKDEIRPGTDIFAVVQIYINMQQECSMALTICHVLLQCIHATETCIIMFGFWFRWNVDLQYHILYPAKDYKLITLELYRTMHGKPVEINLDSVQVCVENGSV